MKLDVGERIVLLSSLPKEGDLPTIRIVHELRQALSFTEEEHKALDIHPDSDQILWDIDAEKHKDIPIGPRAHVLIEDTLKRLDVEKSITEDHLSLWEKFVDGGEEEERKAD